MSARTAILAGKYKDYPAGKAALRAAGGVGTTAELFASFVGYARAHWTYAATSGKQTAPDLLAGDGPKTAACGTLREALKIMMIEDLQLDAKKAETSSSRFLTKPHLQCFDPKVRGNVGNYGRGTFDLACHFSAHYFVEDVKGGKFYDPCLMSVYATNDGPVLHYTKPVTGMPRQSPPFRKAGTGREMVILRLVMGQSVPGFGEVWELFLPAEAKRVLTRDELKALKNDPDVKAAKLL